MRRAEKALAGGQVVGAHIVRVVADEDAGDYGEPEFLAALGTPDGPRCVYKPVSGERPLWDFPDGTLAEREYAARVVSEHLGWSVVPPTVLRDGPAGAGPLAEVVNAAIAGRGRMAAMREFF